MLTNKEDLARFSEISVNPPHPKNGKPPQSVRTMRITVVRVCGRGSLQCAPNGTFVEAEDGQVYFLPRAGSNMHFAYSLPPDADDVREGMVVDLIVSDEIVTFSAFTVVSAP